MAPVLSGPDRSEYPVFGISPASPVGSDPGWGRAAARFPNFRWMWGGGPPSAAAQASIKGRPDISEAFLERIYPPLVSHNHQSLNQIY